jgi:hypothetical protein
MFAESRDDVCMCGWEVEWKDRDGRMRGSVTNILDGACDGVVGDRCC